MDIAVRPSEDAEKYLATDQLVWFGEVTDDDAQHLRLGLPEDQRFAVDLPGGVSEHRPGAYAELARAMRTLVAPEPSIGF